jgi:hypothetical protein
MNQRVGRIGVAVGLIAITLFLPLLAPMPHRIDKTHFQLIKPGMTEAEVEAIFGVPAGGYDWTVRDENMRIDVLTTFMPGWDEKIPADQPAYSGRTMFISAQHGPNPRLQTWFSRHGVYYVVLDQQGRVAVTGSGWGKTRREPPWHKWWQKIAGK